MRKVILICVMVLVFCSLNSQTLRIAAAADLKYAMPEIVALYTKSCPNIKIDVIYGSSGQFFQQISNGAGFDLYFSADILYPHKLKQKGLVEGDVHTYAFGALVLYSTKFDLSDGIDIVNDNKIKRIAIANPAHAPYGKRAEEVLHFYKLYNKVKDKLVFGDNISQTAQFAFTGNADVAIIALSIALSEPIQSKGFIFKLSPGSYNKLEQGCVILTSSGNKLESSKFLQFVLSNNCKPILIKYGFVML